MADKLEEVGENVTRGTEWEVVSLTASAYAASPGPKRVDMNDSDNGNTYLMDDTETSRAMFMSGHFSFPPRQVDQFLVEADRNSDSQKAPRGAGVDSECNIEECGKSSGKNKEDWDIKKLMAQDAFSRLGLFDEKSSKMPLGIIELEASTGKFFDEKIHNICDAAEYSYSDREASVDGSRTEFDRSKGMPELFKPSGQVLGVPAEISPSKPTGNENSDRSNLPCEAWWKRRAMSLYSQAKETNAFWSILIAAAVMGLAVLGQRWQLEKRQILHLKWQFNVNIENPGRVLGPVSRLKDVIVGGHKRGSTIQCSAPSEH